MPKRRAVLKKKAEKVYSFANIRLQYSTKPKVISLF